MPILKQIKNPGGQSFSYHVVQRVEIDPNSEHQFAAVTVASWPDEESYTVNEGRFQAWTWRPTVALAALVGADMIGSIERALTAAGEPVGDSVFSGGSIVPKVSGLAAARLLQWGRVKQTRNLLEQGGFVWDGSTFDSDMLSAARWQATVGAAARAVAAADASWGTPWKLADNSFRLLSAADVMAVDDARFVYMRGLHITSNELFAQINDPSKTTVAEIEAIVWPTAAPEVQAPQQ